MKRIFMLLVGIVAMFSTGCEVDDAALTNHKTYTLYDKAQYNEIKIGQECDLIIISNEYGAKLWEIVIKSQNI
jgi:hypothetical protein